MHRAMTRVVVLIEAGSGWGRRLIRGIANYGLKHGPWQLLVGGKAALAPGGARAGREVDGIIAWVNSRETYLELAATGKPVVNISAIMLDGVDFPRVTTDYDALARLALEHVTERGFNHIAYRGLENQPYGQRHRRAFTKAARAHGLHCDVFHPKSIGHRRSKESERDELLRWLMNLPKPVALFTWDSRMGIEILSLCYEQGLSVPEQVAVLAGDEDELLCECCHPPLSAIVTPGERIGYAAARMLDDMLHGKPAPSEPLLLPPTELVTRQSTDTLAFPDPQLGEAIRFIRENLHRPIQVLDVARAAGISRRSLERRFENILGHSPAREIQHVRLKYAKRLLRETDMSIGDVAAASGYGSLEYMIRIFQKTTGRSPRTYRTWIKAR